MREKKKVKILSREGIGQILPPCGRQDDGMRGGLFAIAGEGQGCVKSEISHPGGFALKDKGW